MANNKVKIIYRIKEQRWFHLLLWKISGVWRNKKKRYLAFIHLDKMLVWDQDKDEHVWTDINPTYVQEIVEI